MKNWLAMVAIGSWLLLCLGCGDGNDTSAGSAQHSTAEATDATGEEAAAATAGAILTGKVIETMDASGYTYVQVETAGGRIWAAAPQCSVAVGDQVSVSTAMPMPDFHSETLNRTFEVVYFTNSFQQAAATEAMPGDIGPPGGHPALQPGAELDLSGIERPEGGRTVAEIFADRQALAGSEVVVRGRVVKFRSGIMGKNWIHLRDGTGDPGANDLTVTTQTAAKVGDLIMVSGKLGVARDFGSGYRYEVIVEDATVAVE